MSDPLILAHLTDAHLPLGRPSLVEGLGKRGLSYVNWLRKRRFLHRPEVAARIVADLKAAKPDFIAMTGDLVNFSLEQEFANGADWLAGLGPPGQIGVTPGNHEAMVRGFEARMMRHWAAYVTGDDGRTGFPWLRRRRGVALIGLSSAVATPPFMATGRLGEDQIGALAGLLSATGREGLCRVVLVHHPPTSITQSRKALTDRAALCEVIASTGAELVLHGHTHRADLSWIDTAAGRVPVIGAPACGMRPGVGLAAGAWRRLEISRHGPGWQLVLRERRVTPAGEVTDGSHLSFHLPGAEVARSAAKP
ncbi:MAG: metallophosphoesterase family protein [Alphaproteobacteria bacterium]